MEITYLKKTYNFHDEWKVEFFFFFFQSERKKKTRKWVCLICGATMAMAKRHNVERHFTKCHTNYHANYSHMIHGTDVISTLSDVQLGATTVVGRVPPMSGNLAGQLDRDLARYRWFSIQCVESVDSSSTAQLMVFIRSVWWFLFWFCFLTIFDNFFTKEELLTLLPLKTTTRGVDICKAVKEFLVEKKVLLEKLVSVTTDGAPAMIGWHTGFMAHSKGDTESNFLHYRCIIHQQALCAKVIGFEHVMTPVVKIINSIRSRAKQHRIF